MKDRRGYILSEIIVAIVIIAFASGIAIPSYRAAIDWAAKKTRTATLKELNAAVDFYRSEYGIQSLPEGSHDAPHHKKILDLLSRESPGEPLMADSKIDPKNLKSSGKGKSFRFTEYQGSQSPQKQNTQGPASPSKKYLTWTGGNKNNASPENPATHEKPSEPPQAAAQNLIKEVENLIEARQTHPVPVTRTLFFENPGTHQWTVPKGVREVTVEVVGAGGSGAKAFIKGNWGPEKTLMKDVLACDRCNQFEGNSKVMATHNLVGPLKFSMQATFPEKKANNDYWIEMNVFRNNALIKSSRLTFDQTDLKYDFMENGPIKIVFTAFKEVRGVAYPGVVTLNNVSYWEYRNAINPHGGGGSGAYSKHTFSGLKGGEHFTLSIGRGQMESNGGLSSVKLEGGPTLTAHGGLMAVGKDGASGGGSNNQGAVGAHGDSGGHGGQGLLQASSKLQWRGSGGNGNDPLGTPGMHGMAKITYVY